MILKDKRIFIVEDNAQNRIIYQMILIRQGAQVDFERRGAEAINRLRSFSRIDLIVLDLMLMQGVTGFDIYDQIRAIPKYDEVPIVAVSAADPSEAIPKVRERGFNGFISKPIDDNLFPQQLLHIINNEPVWDDGASMSNGTHIME
jgi:CheY-like chemotaxis protein